MAMMNFDQVLFLNTYDKLLSEKSFREIFSDILIPLLIEIGSLWQTNTISIAHEHFITYLIKQKLLINTEKIQYQENIKKDRIFVLYLPKNEIHDLGLLYLNYEIQLQGYKTIYLGENVPIASLLDVKKYFNNITYLCYMTVEPNKSEVNDYIKEVKKEVLDKSSKLWVIGRATQFIASNQSDEKITIFNSIERLVNFL